MNSLNGIEIIWLFNINDAIVSRTAKSIMKVSQPIALLYTKVVQHALGDKKKHWLYIEILNV